MLHVDDVESEIVEPEDIIKFFNNIPSDSNYFPYPSKLVLTLSDHSL